MLKQYRIRDYDFKLVFLLLAISAVGIFAIGSAKEAVQSKQIAGLIMAVFLMVIISLFDYTTVLRLYWPMYLGNLVLLLMVKYLGDEGGGAQRWMEIGSFRFQPSETAKIILILFFAQFIMKYREKLNTLKIIVASVALVLVPWVLIFDQPDLSTSVVIIVIFCVMMFAGGISYKLIFSLAAIAIPAVAIIVTLAIRPESSILNEYQRGRILAFFDPEQYATTTAYQQLNSVTAIASGQLEGKGYKNNEITSVKNGNFISEPQTDFIFAVIGEEFGFRGSVVVIGLLMAISLECLSIAFRARDMAGRIIAAGMGGLVAFQTFFNIGVATFILPNTGLPLPFVSYGLTSLMSLYMGMGFVLNVRLQARKL